MRFCAVHQRPASFVPLLKSLIAIVLVLSLLRFGVCLGDLRIGITVHNKLCMVAWSLVLFYEFDVKA